jgi:hypothetical protein
LLNPDIDVANCHSGTIRLELNDNKNREAASKGKDVQRVCADAVLDPSVVKDVAADAGVRGSTRVAAPVRTT